MRWFIFVGLGWMLTAGVVACGGEDGGASTDEPQVGSSGGETGSGGRGQGGDPLGSGGSKEDADEDDADEESYYCGDGVQTKRDVEFTYGSIEPRGPLGGTIRPGFYDLVEMVQEEIPLDTSDRTKRWAIRLGADGTGGTLLVWRLVSSDGLAWSTEGNELEIRFTCGVLAGGKKGPYSVSGNRLEWKADGTLHVFERRP